MMETLLRTQFHKQTPKYNVVLEDVDFEDQNMNLFIGLRSSFFLFQSFPVEILRKTQWHVLSWIFLFTKLILMVQFICGDFFFLNTFSRCTSPCCLPWLVSVKILVFISLAMIVLLETFLKVTSTANSISSVDLVFALPSETKASPTLVPLQANVMVLSSYLQLPKFMFLMASPASNLMLNDGYMEDELKLIFSTSMEANRNLGILTCITVSAKVNITTVMNTAKAITNAKIFLRFLRRSSSDWTPTDSTSVFVGEITSMKLQV